MAMPASRTTCPTEVHILQPESGSADPLRTLEALLRRPSFASSQIQWGAASRSYKISSSKLAALTSLQVHSEPAHAMRPVFVSSVQKAVLATKDPSARPQLMLLPFGDVKSLASLCPSSNPCKQKGLVSNIGVLLRDSSFKGSQGSFLAGLGNFLCFCNSKRHHISAHS